MKSFAALVFLVLLTSFSHAQTPLRVMVLNAEWFWTPHDGKADGAKLKRRDPTTQEYAAERDFYVRLIQEHEIDLVALVEIEHGGVAEDLAKQLGSTWRSYFIQGRDTATGQDVALLSSKTVVAGSVTSLDFPEGKLPGEKKGKRLSKFLALQLDVDGKKVAVLTAHLLSRRDNDRHKTQDRQRQAYAMQAALEKMRESTPNLIMLGDFNSPAKTPEFSLLTDNGRLRSAEQVCANRSGKKVPRSSVDQVFYAGFTCGYYQRIDLHEFSDHEAVVVMLEFDRI